MGGRGQDIEPAASNIIRRCTARPPGSLIVLTRGQVGVEECAELDGDVLGQGGGELGQPRLAEGVKPEPPWLHVDDSHSRNRGRGRYREILNLLKLKSGSELDLEYRVCPFSNTHTHAFKDI